MVAVIGDAIARASLVTDANAMVLRTGESIGALVRVPASMIALSPDAARSPTTVRKFVDQVSKRLRVLATQAATDSDVQDFRRRFNTDGVGGHA